MKSTIKLFVLLLAGIVATQGSNLKAQEKTGFHALTTFGIKTDDYRGDVTIDTALNRLYVSHGMQVNILDAATGDSLGCIHSANEVRHVVIAADFNKGYICKGGVTNIAVFDLKTSQILRQINVGADTYSIFYDDFSKKVYAFNHWGKNATIIDAKTDSVITVIPLGGQPYIGVSDGKGKIFVSIGDTGEVVEINAATDKILNRWKLPGVSWRDGMAIDLKTSRLFIAGGGDNLALHSMFVLDAANGKTVSKIPVGLCDDIAFDPELKLVYILSERSMAIIRELSANKFEFVENIPIGYGYQTIALDEKTHKLYSASSAYLPAPRAAASRRPYILYGTFHVLVVGK